MAAAPDTTPGSQAGSQAGPLGRDTAGLSDAAAALLALEQQYSSGVYPKREVVMVAGCEARLVDADGHSYIDCMAGHGVANCGHGHPVLTAALTAQVGRLVTCPESLPNDVRAEYQRRLLEVAPGDLDRVFLCNSGTEAIEAAFKFARLATGRSGLIATMRGFHGRTFGALSATWEKKYRGPFEPLVPGFGHVPYNKLDKLDAAVGDDTAGVIVEVVQGEGGVNPGEAEFLQGAQALCRERGAMFIVDEIQTGFGRTGRLFACEHHDLSPDILALGKAIGGGLPMGATLVGPRVAHLKPGLHGSTFGGNPLACAVATAVLDVLRDERLPERAAALGARAVARLSALDLPVIREVRGLGLMLAVDLRKRVTPLLGLLMQRGVLALPAGPTVLRLLPPLTIPEADLDRALTIIEETLREWADAPDTGDDP